MGSILSNEAKRNSGSGLEKEDMTGVEQKRKDLNSIEKLESEKDPAEKVLKRIVKVSISSVPQEMC
jgi:hypothetical protein